MSDKKIIIRNCPCFVEGIAIKGNEQKTQTCNNHKVRELAYCADITNCVLKQIVELCKEESSIIQHKQKVKVKGLNKLADRIFELLDIQEVE